MKNKSSNIILILSIAVVILSLTLLKVFNEPQPKLIGSYQSETSPPDIYMLSFFKNGTFEIYSNSILVDEGRYKSTTDEAYIIKSDKENQLLVLNKNDAFYYYSPDNKAYLMKNLDKSPVSIGEPE